MVSEQQMLFEDFKGSNVHASKGNDAQLCTHNLPAHSLATSRFDSVTGEDLCCAACRCVHCPCSIIEVNATLCKHDFEHSYAVHEPSLPE